MPAKPPPLPGQTIGPKIRKARQAAGITQTQLEELIGFTGLGRGSYICRVEAGAQEPRLDTLRRIASALGLKLEQLFS